MNKKQRREPMHEPKDNSPYVHQSSKIGYELKIKELPWTDKQRNLIDLINDRKTRMVLIKGAAGTSKAQPLDAKLLTPTGWKCMGDIKKGDYVIGRNGLPTQILSIQPQGIKKIYNVIFSDGSSVECCGDHLWVTQTIDDRNAKMRIGPRKEGKTIKRAKQGTVKTTEEIKSTLVGAYKHGDKINHSIPLCDPVFFCEQNHLIDPYILGVLIGDGCLSNQIGLSSADAEIVERVKSKLPIGYSINKVKANYGYSITFDKSSCITPNPFRDEIKRLELNCLSHLKRIPNAYLLDSINNRIELLKGLMDTDGGTNGYCHTYSTTSFGLAEDIQFLAQSLGGTATIKDRGFGYYYHDNKKIICKKSYAVIVKIPNSINPFSLKRKANLVIPSTKYPPRRYIVNITDAGQKECQCIVVEDPEHLYLTNDCVVTHNSVVSIYCGLQALNDKKNSHILYSRPIIESADAGSKLGYLPGDLVSKTEPYKRVVNEKLEELLNKGDAEKLNKENRIEFVEVNFIRGASLNSVFLVLDEVQNFCESELITLITRLGRYCKVILCCDPDQSDLPHNKQGGFMRLWSLFSCAESESQGIFRFEFSDDDILRSEFCKFVVKKTRELKESDSAHKTNGSGHNGNGHNGKHPSLAETTTRLDWYPSINNKL